MGKRFGPFEILEELGRGAWGVVYRAVNEASGREVALKLLLTPGMTEKRLKRFEREAQIAAALLEHPGIVSVEGSGCERGQSWIAFSLVRHGRTLGEVFAVAPFEERIRMVRDVAEAIGFAHAKGVVHRDLKTANVLVEADGRVQVTDFGLAAMRGVERLTATGDLIGTPLAMAPEQIGGEYAQISAATDVWALGVLLYRAISGRDPFEGTTFVELGRQIRGQEPPPLAPRSGEGPVPPALDAICRRCLAKDPGARFADGAAVVRALEARSDDGALDPKVRVLAGIAGGVVVTLLISSVVFAIRATTTATVTDDDGPRPAPTEASASPAPVSSPAAGPPSLAAAEQRAQVEAADQILKQLDELPPSSARSLRLAERAVEAAPFYGRARFYRGVVRLTRQQFEGGMADLEQAETAALPFTEPELYEKRGAMYSVRKRYAKAIADFERVYKPSSSSSTAIQLAAMYGISLRLVRRDQRAAEVLGRLWRDHRPSDWRVPYHLAAALRELDRRDEVYPLAKASVDLAGNRSPYPLLRLFSTCIYANRTAEAEALVTPVLARLNRTPEAAEAHYLVGRLRALQGRREEAVAAYRRSIALSKRRKGKTRRWIDKSKAELAALGVR